MIAKNHCLMKLRDKGKYNLEITENISESLHDIEDADKLAEKEMTLNDMQTALLKLSHDQQLCLTLFYLEKHSYTHIAAKTGFSLMQVKSHIQNGKRNLRLLLNKPKN